MSSFFKLSNTSNYLAQPGVFAISHFSYILWVLLVYRSRFILFIFFLLRKNAWFFISCFKKRISKTYPFYKLFFIVTEWYLKNKKAKKIIIFFMTMKAHKAYTFQLLFFSCRAMLKVIKTCWLVWCVRYKLI